MSTKQTLEFFYDYGSPAAYLAWAALPGIVSRTGCTLIAQPFLLGGVFQATGNQAPISVPAKGAYLFTDLMRFAKRQGTPMVMNPHFPINTLAFMRMACGLQLHNPAQLPVLDAAVFNGIWRDGLNMGDPEVAAKTLATAGLDPAALMALSGDAAVKEQLKIVTAQAVERGAFGAPTFFVGSNMFWGQDRLDFVEEALAS